MGLSLEYIHSTTLLSPEEMDGLKIKSISTQGELDEFEQQNIEKAIQWTFGKKLNPAILISKNSFSKFIKGCFRMYGNGLENLENLKKILESHLIKNSIRIKDAFG